jgi:hypothetical protein
MAKKKQPAVPKIGERLLDEEERRVLDEAIAAGYAFLGVPEDTDDFDAVQKLVRDSLKKYGRGKAADSGKSADDLEMCLGAVWGETLRRRANWQWACATVGDEEVYAIFSPKREFVILPIHVIHSQLEMYSPSTLLIYNMVAGGKLPPSEPNARVPLM